MNNLRRRALRGGEVDCKMAELKTQCRNTGPSRKEMQSTGGLLPNRRIRPGNGRKFWFFLVQNALAVQGFDAGKPDGVMGPENDDCLGGMVYKKPRNRDFSL